MSVVHVRSGNSPVVLGLPHTGTDIPADIQARLNPRGKTLSDTDWHVDRLYDQLLPDVTSVRATFHRYVIDANRDPSGASLYPGQNTTGLVPTTDFDGNPLWLSAPTDTEIEQRRRTYHAPYHMALAQEIERVKHIHGVAILFDCHSIRSVIPYLFDDKLPDFNLGTNDGTTCSPMLEKRMEEICRAALEYSTVVNGRFKGGWTTRHYGNPQKGVHALQLELSQSTYLKTESLPFDYDMAKATRLREPLSAMLESLEEMASSLPKS